MRGGTSGGSVHDDANTRDFIESKRLEAVARRNKRLSRQEAEAEAEVDFIAAREFGGYREGWPFTRGANGVGYYNEGLKVQEVKLVEYLPQPPLAPLLISIFEGLRPDGAYGTDRSATATSGTPPPGCDGTATSRRKRAAATSQAWGTSQCPLSGCSSTCSTTHVAHIDAGCWAMDTINPNCWERAAAYLRLAKADFIGIQDTKLALGRLTAEAEEGAKGLEGLCRWLCDGAGEV